MIIWINGPFGSGKSTLANGLRKALLSSVAADPEEIVTCCAVPCAATPPPCGTIRTIRPGGD
ncbi:hypothetical protein ACIP46_39365 [Streptomyces lavendulae]|uniref:hypothetical protein n=1 Tax=Streptomyces lavendulae TaxID=1914 RepID=UPI0033209D10